ncbi:MAG TPA: WecB/TagA/CpsF family glycosyltransferase [Candidatus Angelobacter sp.]|jgi:exopolysaccharide biosynthesis WecB/TagA/CpsF family protein|nr:WecB/TagA/CpsF family glycosyltransferase [Candidatus Angelobacter sp.]
MSAARKKNILGILIDDASLETATAMVIEAARRGGGFAVSALAVHGVMEGVLDTAHRYRLNHLELTVADGQPVRWALNHLHAVGLRQRVYGPNLTLAVVARAEQEDLPVYFYGSTQEVLALMCSNLQQRFPKLRIAGATPSTFGRITLEAANRIGDQIRQSGAQIVFVGLGCPRQEVWAYEFRDRIQLPILAVGAAFPFLAGTLRQAPKWMQDRGLEWLFRLCTEPRRLWRRYLMLSPAYLLLVACQWLGFTFQTTGTPPAEEVLYG